jgi:starch-binding outer membrane protein, SusD/RagB family
MPFVRGGNIMYTPTQQLVDSYETLDGKPIIDASSGYDPQNPYVNRDPRLDVDIYHQGSKLNSSTIDFTNPGGIDFDNNNTVTGYLLGKFVDPAVYDNTGVALGTGQGNQPWIYFRYAEILLNYAEAINEAEGPANAYAPVNEIRNRAGLPALPDGLSQSQMRARIQNERKVELAFEEHRFWDVRRWKIAMVTNNVTTMGVSVTKNSNGVLHYDYVVPNTGGNLDYDPVRVFKDANYFFPIPKGEIDADPKLTQNPGY